MQVGENRQDRNGGKKLEIIKTNAKIALSQLDIILFVILHAIYLFLEKRQDDFKKSHPRAFERSKF